MAEAELVWELDHDPDTGDPYWYNNVTEESSWEEPLDLYNAYCGFKGSEPAADAAADAAAAAPAAAGVAGMAAQFGAQMKMGPPAGPPPADAPFAAGYSQTPPPGGPPAVMAGVPPGAPPPANIMQGVPAGPPPMAGVPPGPPPPSAGMPPVAESHAQAFGAPRNGPPAMSAAPSRGGMQQGPTSGWGSAGPPTQMPRRAAAAPKPRVVIWEEDQDPESGDPFWYNTLTGESTWEKPESLYAPEEAGEWDNIGTRQEAASVSMAFNAVSAVSTATAKPDAGIQLIMEDDKPKEDPRIVKKRTLAPDVVDKTAAEIQQYNMMVYANQFLLLPKKKLFGQEKTLMDLLGWSPNALARPLHKALQGNSSHTKRAVRISKDITAFSGDRKGKLNPGDMTYAKALVQKGIEGCADTRDECYVQLIRHITNNPNSDKKGESLKRTLELLGLCCDCFPASDKLFPYLDVFMQRQAKIGADKEMKKVCTYARKCLWETQQVGARNFPPTTSEWKAMSQGRNELLRVGLLDGTTKTCKLRPQMSAAEVCDTIASKMALKLPTFNGVSCFGLYQVAKDKKGLFVSESIIEDDFRVADVLSVQEQARENNPESTLEFCVVYKARLFLRHILETVDNNSLHLYYIQALYDVSHGIVPVAEQQAHVQAGLALQVEYATKDVTIQEVADKLESLLPPRFTAKHKKAVLGLNKEAVAAAEQARRELAKTIIAEREQYRGWNVPDSKYQFVTNLHKVPLYGCVQFIATQIADVYHEDWDYKQNRLTAIDKKHERNLKKRGKRRNDIVKPVSLTLGVNEMGVFLLDKKSRQMTRMDKLGWITSQGAAGRTVVIVSCNPAFHAGDKRALVFNSPHALKILELLRTYKKVARGNY